MKKLLLFALLLIAPSLAWAQDFYFLIGLIKESTAKKLVLDVKNYTDKTIFLDPRLSVLVGTDSVWLDGPGKILSFAPNASQVVTFSTSDSRVDMSDFKSKYVSVFYTITPHYTLSFGNVVATKPIDGQYIRLELALPVELIGFVGKTAGLSNLLEWVTASEKDAHYFDVEKSMDGKAWAKIGRVTASGNSNTLRSYYFEDLKPSDKPTYYRLKQVDFDLKHEYSKIIAINSVGGAVPLSVDYYDVQGRKLPGKRSGLSIEVTTTTKGKNSKLIYAQ